MNRLLLTVLLFLLPAVGWAETQTHATDCTSLTCDAARSGHTCYEIDDDAFYVCDSDGPGWVLVANAPVTAEEFNILNFGALCDGATNDGPSINAAADAADADGGGTLVFPNGDTCPSTETITIHDNTDVDLNGATLKFEVDGQVEDLQLQNNTSIRNGTIENAGTNPSDAGNWQSPIVIGNFLSGVGYSNVVLENLTIVSNRPAGFGINIFGDSSNVSGKNITFPASVFMATMVQIHWGNATDPHGTPTTHPHDISFDNIKVGAMSNNPDDATQTIFWLSGAYNVKISNVSGDDLATGVVVYAGDHGAVDAATEIAPLIGRGISVHNMSLTNVYRGIRVVGKPASHTSNPLALPLSVKDSVFVGRGSSTSANNDVGIQLNDCSGVTLRDVEVSEFFENGITAKEAVDALTIEDSYVHHNGTAGIWLNNAASQPTRPVVRDSLISFSGQRSTGPAAESGIYIAGAIDALIENNQLGEVGEDSQSTGIWADTGTVRATIRGNHVLRTQTAGSDVPYSNTGSTRADTITMNWIFIGNTADSGITNFFSGATPYNLFPSLSFLDDDTVFFGTDDDASILHNNTDWLFTNGTGNILIDPAGFSDFTNGIFVSKDEDFFSRFGGDPATLNPSDAADRLVIHKTRTGTSGQRRAALFILEVASDLSVAAGAGTMGLNSFVYTQPTTTANQAGSAAQGDVNKRRF